MMYRLTRIPCMQAILLLLPDARGHRLPARVPQPPRRRGAPDAHQARGPPRPPRRLRRYVLIGLDWLGSLNGRGSLLFPYTHRSMRTAGDRGDRGDRQFEKEKRMGPDGSFQPTYVSPVCHLCVCVYRSRFVGHPARTILTRRSTHIHPNPTPQGGGGFGRGSNRDSYRS